MTSPVKFDASLIEKLRGKGYKVTPQRIAICRIVLNSRSHPSAQQVYDEVKKLHPTVSLATVYKTLEVLRNLDLVQEINFSRGQARFDSYLTPHINLVCLKCGKIADVDDVTVKEMTTRVAAAAKFKLVGQRMDVYGFCQKCSGTL